MRFLPKNASFSHFEMLEYITSTEAGYNKKLAYITSTKAGYSPKNGNCLF